MPLLATKFSIPPLRPGFVARPHLLQRLTAGRQGQVLLISAPAGFGKTTLAASWVRQADWPVAWLSLEEADDDPVRFFAYFIAALQRLDAAVGRGLEAILAAGELPSHAALVTTLVNDLAGLSSPCLCVLDDFQVIQDQAIQSALHDLVLHQPPCFHLMLVTREDPPLPLSRLRVQNQLVEMRVGDLRFSPQEASQFLLEGMGLALSPQILAVLEDRIEGWVAGLQLAGLSLQGREDTADFAASLGGGHRYILSYLTEEVLRRQPEAVQAFLLSTSVLARLTGPLCEAVTGQPGGAEMLEKLSAANLFLIPLDDEQRWYRYHHLFADLLRNQLRHSQPDRLRELHGRASAWYEAQSMPGEAVDHALAAQDYARVVKLLDQHAFPVIMQGYVKTAEHWLQALPAHWQRASLRTNLTLAWMQLMRGYYAQVAPSLAAVEAALADGAGAEAEAAEIRVETLALRANLLQVQGQLTDSVAFARQALEQAAPESVMVRGSAYLALGGAYRQMGDLVAAMAACEQSIQLSRMAGSRVAEMLAVSIQALMAGQCGRLHYAVDVCTQAIQAVEREGTARPLIVGTVYNALALIYYEWNRLEAVEDLLARSVQLNTLSGHPASLTFAKLAGARLAQAGGDLTASAGLLAEARDLFGQGVPSWLGPEILAQHVSLCLAQGNPEIAEAVVRQGGFVPGEAVNYRNETVQLAYLRVLLHLGRKAAPHRLAQGRELADQVLASAEAGQRLGIALSARVVQALIQSTMGDQAGGLETLALALELAEREGYVRSFVDEGEAMRSLLQRVPASDVHFAYVRDLLTSFPHLEAPVPPQTHEELVEPLTDRELDVLRLLAQGLTYKEIAGKLVVSVNTVRFHVKGIYGKLGAEKLSQAVERAGRLKLI